MKNQSLQTTDTETLQKRQKALQVLAIMLGSMLIVLLCLSIVISIKKGFTVLMAIPVALSPIIIINIKNIAAIRKELSSRKFL